MFFLLSKTIGMLLVPSTFLMILAIIGLLLLATHWARMGWRLIIGSVLGLAVLGLTPIGNALTVPLEGRFPPWDPSRGAPSGIIILGGAINPEISEMRGTTALGDAAERVTVVADLLRRYPEASVVFSGGNSRLLGGGRAEADYFVQLLRSFGIHSNRVRLENRSRNTAENAAFSAEMISAHPGDRWLLITSAIHMPRAMGVFRKAGLPVEAYPVDWRTTGPQDLWNVPDTFAGGLSRVDAATREWVGLFVYWITGQSSELYPGPDTTHRFAERESDVGGVRKPQRSSADRVTANDARRSCRRCRPATEAGGAGYAIYLRYIGLSDASGGGRQVTGPPYRTTHPRPVRRFS